MRQTRGLILTLIGLVLCRFPVTGLEWHPCSYICDPDYPDVNKRIPPGASDQTCWLAAAANVLAAAGYCNGVPPSQAQVAAMSIYADMVGFYGRSRPGWVDSAIQWWLDTHPEAFPRWGSNWDLTVYGNKVASTPWSRTDAPQIIAASIMASDSNNYSPGLAAIAITEPTADSEPGSRPHALTVWGNSCGDYDPADALSGVCVLDSDRGGQLPKAEPYWNDPYDDPNPGGPNEGNGWYFDYHEPPGWNHWFVQYACVFAPGGSPSYGQGAPLEQASSSWAVGAPGPLAGAFGVIRPGSPLAPLAIRPGPDALGAPALRSTQGALPIDVSHGAQVGGWTMPVESSPASAVTTYLDQIDWNVTTREFASPNEAALIPNVTGGYVVGAFDICDPSLPRGQRIVAEYRFIKPYRYNQTPEEHTFTLAGPTPGATCYTAGNFRFGQSYGYLLPDELWAFDNWMTQRDGPCMISERPIRIAIHWPGRLPYPQVLPYRQSRPRDLGFRLFGDKRQGIGFVDNTTGATAGGLCVVFDRQVTITNVLGFGGELTLTGSQSGYAFVFAGHIPPQSTIELDWRPGEAVPLGSMWLGTGFDISGSLMEALLREVLGDTPLPPIW